jgi:hypothetical protein
LILHCRVGFTGIAVGSAGCRPSWVHDFQLLFSGYWSN